MGLGSSNPGGLPKGRGYDQSQLSKMFLKIQPHSFAAILSESASFLLIPEDKKDKDVFKKMT